MAALLPGDCPLRPSPSSTRPAGAVRGEALDGDQRLPRPALRAAARSAGCAGGRRRRCGPGAARATRPPSARPACSRSPRPGSIYYEALPAMSEDCLTLNIWAPADARNAPVFVWIHGGALTTGASRQAMYDGAAHGPARGDRRLDQLPARHPRLSRPSRPQRGIARGRVRQLRPAGPDRGAALGEPQHRRVRRQSRQRHHRRGIGGRAQRHVSDGGAAGARPVRQGDHAERLYGLRAGAAGRSRYGGPVGRADRHLADGPGRRAATSPSLRAIERGGAGRPRRRGRPISRS